MVIPETQSLDANVDVFCTWFSGSFRLIQSLFLEISFDKYRSVLQQAAAFPCAGSPRLS